MKTQPTTVVSIDRTQILLCAAHHAKPLQFNLTPDLVQDLEIINRDVFTKNFATFLAAAKLKPGKAIFIFDQTMSFIKDYPGTLPPTPETTQKFLDTVPLRSVSGKLFKSTGGFKLVVVNRELFEILSKHFSDLGFSDTVLVPSFTLVTLGIKDLSSASCHLLLKKSDRLLAIHSPTEDSNPPIISRNRNLLIFLSIVSILSALVTAVLTLGPVFRKKPTAQAPSVAVRKPTPTIAQSPTPPTTPKESELSALTVQVLNASGTPGLAASVTQKLTTLGFRDVTLGNATTRASVNTLLIFNSKVSNSIRLHVTDQLSPLVATISAQEATDTQFDITVMAVAKN